MLVDELIVAVVLQKGDTVLNDDSGNQAIDGISDGAPRAPKLPIDGGGQLKGRPIIVKVDKSFEQTLGGHKLVIVSDALKDLCQHKATAAYVVPSLNRLLEESDLGRLSPAEKIDPNRRIDEKLHGVRVVRICWRSPAQRTFPFNASRPVCFSRRTNSLRA